MLFTSRTRQRTDLNVANVRPYFSGFSWQINCCMRRSRFKQDPSPLEDPDLRAVRVSHYLQGVSLGFTPSLQSVVIDFLEGENFHPNSDQTQIPRLRISATCSARSGKCFLRDMSRVQFSASDRSVRWWGGAEWYSWTPSQQTSTAPPAVVGWGVPGVLDLFWQQCVCIWSPCSSE